MRQTAADPKDPRTRTTQTIEGTAVEIHHDSGTVSVLRSDGSPMLTITGMQTPIPDLEADANVKGPLTVKADVPPPADPENDPNRHS